MLLDVLSITSSLKNPRQFERDNVRDNQCRDCTRLSEANQPAIYDSGSSLCYPAFSDVEPESKKVCQFESLFLPPPLYDGRVSHLCRAGKKFRGNDR